MPNFSFTARDNAGQWHEGKQTADSAGALAAALRLKGWSLVNAKIADVGPVKRKRYRGILPATSYDVEMGLRMIAAMLDGGITLLSALKTATEQARRPSMANIWDDVHDRVIGRMPFAEALAIHKKVFPPLVVQLAKAGEVSGNLEVVLDQAAEQLERKRNLMITLTSALMYPAITTVMALGVGIYLMLKVIPEISQFLRANGQELPAMTQALIKTSDFFRAYIIPMTICAVSGTIALVLARMFPPAARVVDRSFLRIPIVGTLLKLGGTTLFARVLGMLLEAGVPMLAALDTAGAMMKNKAIAARVTDSRRAVLAGNPLARPLGTGGEFMAMLPRMVAVGEETGTLSGVLVKVANFHEKQLEAYVKRMTLLIEPVMTVVVGGMVGFVYLAFFMAIYSIIGGGQQG